MKKLLMPVLLVIAVAGMHLPASARTVNVNCSTHGSIGAALRNLNPDESNTLNVSGVCRENVSISGFNRLTIIGVGQNASSLATVQDASGGTLSVFDVADSRVRKAHAWMMRSRSRWNALR